MFISSIKSSPMVDLNVQLNIRIEYVNLHCLHGRCRCITCLICLEDADFLIRRNFRIFSQFRGILIIFFLSYYLRCHYFIFETVEPPYMYSTRGALVFMFFY
jgi:hypothetical protein